MGYANGKKILYDETQAFLSTGVYNELDTKEIKRFQKEFVKFFKEFKKRCNFVI